MLVSPSGYAPSSETYFGCIVVPGDNFLGHARAVQPFVVWLETWDLFPYLEKGSARYHRRFEGQKPNVTAWDHSP